MIECRAGQACTKWNDPIPGHAPLIYDGEYLCEHCLTRAERDTRALLYNYLDLEQLHPPTLEHPYDKDRTGTPEPRANLNLTADTLMTHIAWTLTVWEAAIRDTDDLSNPPPGHVRDGYAVQRAVQILAPRVQLMATIDAHNAYHDGPDTNPYDMTGIDALLRITTLHHTARNILGTTQLIHVLPGPCSACKRDTLRRRNGSGTVYCAACDTRWTLDQYHRYVTLTLTLDYHQPPGAAA